MRIAYLDCFAGISGDMFLGALLDAGVPLGVLDDAVSALSLDASLRVEKVDRSGISSIKVHVLDGDQPAEQAHEHARGHLQKHEHKHFDEHAHEAGSGHSQEHLHEHAEPHVHAPVHEESSQQQAHEHPHEHVHEASHAHQHSHAHGRSLTRIRELIQAAPLAPSIKEFAIHTFELLGSSEAKIHNVAVEQIHFHEVGAVDAIVDIVAAAAGIDHLSRQGEIAWFCSPINVGGGMVECAHGTFPVPAPATADLLRGMPTYSAHVQKELVTPTGAAILRALVPRFGMQPSMRVQSIGYGAGSRNPKGFPNVLRLSLGVSEATSSEDLQHTQDGGGETVTVLETALDDASPQLLAYVAEQALAAGALDVMLTPVVMKKGRPATLMTVLCSPADTAQLESLLLRETTTLGIRKHREGRSCLERRHVIVSTQFGDLRVKVGLLRGEEVNVMPEFEDCRAAAGRHDVPLKHVMQAALAAYACSPVR